MDVQLTEDIKDIMGNIVLVAKDPLPPQDRDPHRLHNDTPMGLHGKIGTQAPMILHLPRGIRVLRLKCQCVLDDRRQLLTLILWRPLLDRRRRHLLQGLSSEVEVHLLRPPQWTQNLTQAMIQP